MFQTKKPPTPILNQEDIYQLLVKKEWASLLSFVWQNPSLIDSDPIIKHAVATCETEFFSNLERETDKEKLVNTLETFHLLHTGHKYHLAEDKFRIVIVELVKLWRDKNLEQAYSRAKNFPDDEVCRAIIKEYEDSLPKQVLHSQSHIIQVTENKNILNADGRRTLFKSLQEREFFGAVRDEFPMFTVYPNVGLSSIIEFKLVKDSLSSAEKDFFFKGVVDCVVFDHHDLYLPKFFYELDSVFHDNPEQKQKDQYKDKILAAAGQKLLRIRRTNEKQNRGDFAKLIRDITEKNNV
jgi:hypothetical protein